MSIEETQEPLESRNAIIKQIGSHVLSLLEHPDTVATVTTVVDADPSPRLVSIALTSSELEQVSALVEEARRGEPPRTPCIGFHCFLDADEPEDDPRDGRWSEELHGND